MGDKQNKGKKKKLQDKVKSENELEKLWQVVRENPADFGGWTYLLHYVEHENNIEAAREAFTAFFKHYPYCFAYWKKFADMEKNLGSPESCEKVFEDGVKAVPLSVDLWIQYLNFYKQMHKEKEDYEKVKELFQRSLKAAGYEFHSDELWNVYVAWEEKNNNLQEVTAIYDTLLRIPTKGYGHNFENFCKHVKNNSPGDILSTEEFFALRPQVVSGSADLSFEDNDDEKVHAEDSTYSCHSGCESISDVPPGMEAPSKIDMMSKKEIQLMKKKIIEKRKLMHEKNEAEVRKRWSFEEGIKRPYFHVKSLDRTQLKNWIDYLDFEIENGTHERVVILFERCMIACALYEDMWLKYIWYIEEKDPVAASLVYMRACTVHLPKKPTIHFAWAAYEEQRGNPVKAFEILENLSRNIPDFLEIQTRQINLKRRCGNRKSVEDLYTKYIAEAKSTQIASFLSAKYARYLYKVEGNFIQATEVLKNALIKDPTNSKLYMQLVDVGFQKIPIDIPLVCEAFNMALASNMAEDQKLAFSQRKLEFVEDFGLDPQINQKAYEAHIKRLKISHIALRKRTAECSDEQEKKIKAEVNAVPSVITSFTVTAAASTGDTSYNESPWVRYHNNNYNYSWNYPSYH